MPTSPRRLATLASIAVVGLLASCGAESDVRSGDVGSTTVAITSTAATTTGAPATTTSELATTIPPSIEPPMSTTSPTTDAPLDCVSAAVMPPMVAAEADGYDTVGTHEGLGAPDDREVVLFTSGGAVATEHRDEGVSTVEYRIGPAGGIGPHGTIEHAMLHDLVLTPEGPAVLYGEVYQGNEERAANLNLLDIGTGASRTITASEGPEYFVYRAAAAEGIIVTSAHSDLTENISTWALDGSGQLERYSPVLPERYGLPPFYGPAVPSPDGTQLAWLEGPDAVGGGGGDQRAGDWELVVADAFTGEVSLRLFLASIEDQFIGFDWDGEWAVLSRGQGLPVLGVYTAKPSTSPFDVCGADGLLTGIVTLVVS